MQNILLVRLNSISDIIHNFPAVTDLVKHFPHARIDWLVNQDFADLPQLHPNIHHVITCNDQAWQCHPFSSQTWQEYRACRTQLRQIPYDLVIDSHGLLKSAWLSNLTKRPIAGYDAYSVRERLATYFYTYDYTVSWRLDAIARNRLLTGQACGYKPDHIVDYGIPHLEHTLPGLPEKHYIVFLTASSRQEKKWPLSHWIAIGTLLSQMGFTIVLPWGKPSEYEDCKTLSSAIPAMITPKLPLKDMAFLLQEAKLVIGIDTGLTHLAAAVNTPVIMLFSGTDPKSTGVQSQGYAVNLGQTQAPASIDTVIAHIHKGLTQ